MSSACFAIAVALLILFQSRKAGAELAVRGIERFASCGSAAYHLRLGSIVDTFTHLVDSSDTAQILSHIFGKQCGEKKKVWHPVLLRFTPSFFISHALRRCQSKLEWCHWAALTV